jgi:hypothetical protein
MACSGCAAGKQAANAQRQVQPVRQLPQRTSTTPNANKQAEFRNRMRFAGKK